MVVDSESLYCYQDLLMKYKISLQRKNISLENCSLMKSQQIVLLCIVQLIQYKMVTKGRNVQIEWVV